MTFYIDIFFFTYVCVCIYAHMSSNNFDCFSYHYLFLLIPDDPERKVYMSQPLLPLSDPVLQRNH